MEEKSKVQKLQNFITANLERIQICGRNGSDRLNFPDFELFPFDYLEYAEAEMVGIEENDNKKINCISHLKRAIECELDSFLYAMGLSTFVKPVNFPTKMEWMGGMGIFTPRSLRRLNSIRNEMEHDYSIPKIQDIELYFDLTSTFVHTLEGFLVLIDNNQILFWAEGRKNFDETVFSVSYDYKKAILNYELGPEKQSEILSFEPSNKDEFLFAFRTYLLLCRNASDLVDNAFVIKKIQN
jgi:hypothetical protein